MSGFSADWLALREPFDRAARESAAVALDWPAFASRMRAGRAADAVVNVLDLGSGTGASLRELAPRIGGVQHWRLVDHDMALLAAAPDELARWAQARGWQVRSLGDVLRIDGDGLRLDIACVKADLAASFDALPFDGTHLVSCAALLDLVSQPWLDALAARCAAVGAAVCWALSVDGRGGWSTADADDALMNDAFRAHQRRDKGFGPALGDAAVAAAMQALARAGYRVGTAESDWLIDGTRSATDRAMLQALIDGAAQAAREQCPVHATRIDGWRTRRLAALDAACLRVGHADLLAWR